MMRNRMTHKRTLQLLDWNDPGANLVKIIYLVYSYFYGYLFPNLHGVGPINKRPSTN